MNEQSQENEWLIHVLAWTAFVAFPLLFLPENPFFDQNGKVSPLFFNYITSIVFLVGVFYLNVLVFIPKYYLAKKFILYTTIIALYFLVTLLLVMISGRLGHIPAEMPQPMHNMPPFPPRQPPILTSYVLRFVLVILFGLMITTYRKWKESEWERLKSELNLLKSQVNPHFLFNTLNSIYMLAVKKSDVAPDSILKLSSIMRYVTIHAQSEQVGLDQEIKYIEDFIDLQRLRLTENMVLDIHIQAKEPENVKIVPFLLIPFVENAFKYGVSTETPAKIEVSIVLKGKQLSMKVKNSIFAKNLHAESSGTGIKNTRKQLELSYPGHHSFAVHRTENTFEVILSLDIR